MVGLQNHGGKSNTFAEVDIINGAQRFISQLKAHLPNLKELIFRGEQWWCNVYSGERIECRNATIARDVYFALKDAGYKVTLFDEGEYDEQIDRLLRRWSLTAEQYCGLIRMAWLLKSTDDIVEFSPGADYEYEQGTGRLAQRIMDGYYFSQSFMPAYEETKVCLQRAIAAYSTLAKDNLGLSMILYTSVPACDVALERVMRLIYLAASKTTPTLLDTVVRIQEMRLYYGADLMQSYFIPGSENDLKLYLICHTDTAAILTALRGFIPNWTQEDLEQEYLKAQNNYDLSGMIPYHKDLEVSEVYKGAKERKITRRTLFKSFCRALGRYDQGTQLIRLQRLLQVLQLEHIRTADLLEEYLYRAAGYIYEETRAMPDADSFLGQIRTNNFNPMLNSTLSSDITCNLM